METIEVITEVQRRRRFSLAEKVRAVEEANLPGMNVSLVARKYGISASMLFKWRNLMADGGKKAVQAEDEVVAAAEMRELKRQIAQLQRVLGKTAMENEILREAVKIAHEKKRISRLPCLPPDDLP
jgi:transposase